MGHVYLWLDGGAHNLPLVFVSVYVVNLADYCAVRRDAQNVVTGSPPNLCTSPFRKHFINEDSI